MDALQIMTTEKTKKTSTKTYIKTSAHLGVENLSTLSFIRTSQSFFLRPGPTDIDAKLQTGYSEMELDSTFSTCQTTINQKNKYMNQKLKINSKPSLLSKVAKTWSKCGGN